MKTGKYGPEKLRIWTYFTQCHILFEMASVDVKVSELHSKIGIFKEENKLLKESFSNKQKLIEVLLEDYSVLIKEKSRHVINPNINK